MSGVVTYCKPCGLIIYNGGAGAGAKDDLQDRAGFEKKHVDDCIRLSELIQKESSQYCLDTDVTPEVHLESITFFLADNIEQLLLEWLIRFELVKERLHIRL